MVLLQPQRGAINISAVYQNYAALLDRHAALLASKNVRTKQRLLEIIKLDLDKLTYALLALKTEQADVVLRTFFAGQDKHLAAILATLARETIDHLGFEIHEPLDLVLQGLDHWMAKTRRTLGCALHISQVLRFPASAAFQQRVGAPTEIMRLWMQVEGRTLKLELFDIQRPVDGFLTTGAPRLAHRNFDCLITSSKGAAVDGGRLARLFSTDPIWHYAFWVRTPADIVQLHTALQALTATDPAYRLPYAAPVQNRGDGSFHTKIINQRLAQEVEFVAHAATHVSS